MLHKFIVQSSTEIASLHLNIIFRLVWKLLSTVAIKVLLKFVLPIAFERGMDKKIAAKLSSV